MQGTIHPNDLPVLAKIFNPTTQYIFLPKRLQDIAITDTLACQIIFYESDLFLKEICNKYTVEGCTLFNPSTTHLISQKLTTIQIDLSSYPETSHHWINLKQSEQNLSSDKKSLDFKEYHFINNPDQTIRWLYPARQKNPTFLHLYNASGWKGQLIKIGIKAGFRCGLSQRIKQGTIRVYAPYAPVGGELQKSSTIYKTSDFAIFTGTKGENRKAVIAFEKNKRATHFLKVPLTKAANTLVVNESERLKELANYSFETLVIPQAKRIHQHLLQTNIRPTSIRPNLTITTTHLQALWELYQETTDWKLLQQTTAWTAIEDNLSTLKKSSTKNNLSISTVQQIVTQLRSVQSQMDNTLPIPIALAHGDFTPWNSYLTSNKIMVYDWELAEKFPLLYDAFHFIFQSSILVKKQSFGEIKKQIETLREHQIVQELQTQFNFSFDDAYRFYLLQTISYYLSRYVRQAHLHEQAHWLIDTWKEALEEVITADQLTPY